MSRTSSRLHRWFVPAKLQAPVHPALLERERKRAEDRQNRLADSITSFAGSMAFVYVHVIWFACWIGFAVENYPFGLLTMIVSLEAIFLSTFILISQNRADAKRQVIADAQWETVQEEDRQNLQLLQISGQILSLTQEVRSLADSFVNRSEIESLAGELGRLTAALVPPDHPAADK